MASINRTRLVKTSTPMLLAATPTRLGRIPNGLLPSVGQEAVARVYGLAGESRWCEGAVGGAAPLLGPVSCSHGTLPGDGVTRRDDFERYYGMRAREARRYAAAILADRASAELDDTLQTAWAKAWAAWDQAEESRRDAWFFRIVRNSCIDVHRRRRRSEPLDEVTAPPVEVIEPLIDRLDAKRVVETLGWLSQPLREALWLREGLGMTYAEIAAVQNVPEGTVMSRLFSARRQMAKRLRRAQ